MNIIVRDMQNVEETIGTLDDFKFECQDDVHSALGRLYKDKTIYYGIFALPADNEKGVSITST
jgi:hypothetical protein